MIEEEAFKQTQKDLIKRGSRYGSKTYMYRDRTGFIVYKDGRDGGEITLQIAFDRDYYDRITNEDFEAIWNNLSNKEKSEFHKEHKSFMDDDVWDEMVMKGKVLNNNWDEMKKRV